MMSKLKLLESHISSWIKCTLRQLSAVKSMLGVGDGKVRENASVEKDPLTRC